MKILISGASGLIGSALQTHLVEAEHDVCRLTRIRGDKDASTFYWDPYTEYLDERALEGVDAVIHLSGANIAGRWTTTKKKVIRESRVQSTRFLSQTVSNYAVPPRVLLCASAIGYYGHRGDEILNESSKFGSGFLVDVTREWEAATTPASVKGVRVVNLRFGLVLSSKGGSLAKMLPVFKMGGGGIIGSGSQHWSWISIDDVVGAIYHVLTNKNISGPVNIVAPNSVTSAEFTKMLGQMLSRPTFMPLPKFALKLVLGEMADTLLLASTRVTPKKLLESGFEFKHPELAGALQDLLGT